MKNFKKIIAICIVLAVALLSVACSPKGEIGGEIKDSKSKETVEITTAQYLYALSSAVQEANSLIDQANSDKEIKNYAKYKVVETDENGKEVKTKYEKWVKAKTDEILKNYAASIIKADAYKLKLSKDEKADKTSVDEETWKTNSFYFYNNGVGYNTVCDYQDAKSLKINYFYAIYGEEGEKPLKEEEYVDYFNKNFCLVNIVSIATSEGVDGDEEETGKKAVSVKEAKNTLKSYQKKLKAGKMAFVDAYVEIMDKYDSTTLESRKNEDGEYSEDIAETVSYSPEVGTYRNNTFGPYLAQQGMTLSDMEPGINYVDNFADFKDMKVGSYKIFEAEDGSSVFLVEKLDINEIKEHVHEEGEEHDHEEGENTHLENYRDSILHILKDEEFNKNFDAFAKALKITLNSATDGITYEDIDLATAEESKEE